MDETNFNLYISRRQGRSKKGTRCTNIAAGTRGKNVHVIGCIGNLGLIYSQFRRGPYKIPEANEFVRSSKHVSVKCSVGIGQCPLSSKCRGSFRRRRVQKSSFVEVKSIQPNVQPN